jgi:hypothetical protein
VRRYIYVSPAGEESLTSAERYDGVALGSEYCAFLLPDDRELEAAVDWSVSRSKELTLLLPYLREHLIKGIMRSIRKIMDRTRPRLVVNDWGTLYILSKMVPEADLVLGRLLSGQKVCVRVENSPFLTEEGKRLLHRDLFSSEEMREFFQKEFGITSISTSSTPTQPLQIVNYARLIHFPYVLVTVTDFCPYRGNLPSALISSCQRICRKGYVVLSNDSLGQVMYQRGRGRFFNPFPEPFEFPDTDNGEIIVYNDVP